MADPADTQRTARSVPAERITVPLSAILGLALTLALGLGSVFYGQLVAAFRDVAGEVRALREGLGSIDRRVTVLEAPGLEARVRDLERRAAVSEAKQQGGGAR